MYNKKEGKEKNVKKVYILANRNIWGNIKMRIP